MVNTRNDDPVQDTMELAGSFRTFGHKNRDRTLKCSPVDMMSNPDESRIQADAQTSNAFSWMLMRSLDLRRAAAEDGQHATVSSSKRWSLGFRRRRVGAILAKR